MLEKPNFQHTDTANDWALRSENWISELQKMKPRRRVRDRRKTPLILCGHGVSMRVENGALVIRDGFTHYPQEQTAYRYFRGDLELPPRIILLDGSGTLSFDVLSWLGEQGVALARVKWNGEVAVVASGSGYAADQAKVDWQRQTRSDDARRFTFASQLIQRKLAASCVTLESCIPASPARDIAIQKATDGIARLRDTQTGDMNAVYAVEGDCANAYFAAWKAISIRWKGISRRPVPPSWMTYRSRSSLLSGLKPKNRLASHPINAMLNYAYAVRQTQLHIEAITDGYNPTLGIMHNRHQGSAAYILDLIEPERPMVDATVLQLIFAQSFSADDFVIRNDGVCRLSPQLARAVVSNLTATIGKLE